jgi:ectoine hydroxylase-related dioxygenase (phytanoyl-CoA dioxygenase family)
VGLAEDQKRLWLRELELNGFVVLRRFLPVELVRAMREELEPLLEAEYEKAKAAGFEHGRMPGRLSLHIAEYADMLRGALADERYRRNAVIEELVDAVIGPGQWARGWTVVEAVWQEADYMSWHSDQKIEDTPDLDAAHETIRMTFNIPLVDFTWSSGATEYIPGSHRLPRRFHTESLVGIPHLYTTRLELALGDAVLRDGNTLHRGSPNLSGVVRPMLDQTYKKKAAPSGG